MSFWLEDDDDDHAADFALSSFPSSQLQKDSQSQSQPKQLPIDLHATPVYLSQAAKSQFVCINCSGSDYYHDEAAGMDVCQACFTQTQSLSQTELDFDDVMGLAARNAGGKIQQRRTNIRRKVGETGRQKRPLEELDKTVKLPDTSACLEGMERVLKKCVDIVVTDLLPSLPSFVKTKDKRKSQAPGDDLDGARREGEIPNESKEIRSRRLIMHMVRDLWMSYLRAWADGAELYGAKQVGMRFCFRDLFLGSMQMNELLSKHLVYQAQQVAASATENHEDVEKNSSFDSDHSSDDENSDFNEATQSGTNTRTGAAGVVAKERRPLSRSKAYKEAIMAHTGPARKDYREAALVLPPSMTMVAALVWLAIIKNKESHTTGSAVVTSRDMCDWIQSGKLPLMTAFRNLLSKRLRRKLYPVASFFRMIRPVRPAELEAAAMYLCGACRLLTSPETTYRDNYQSNRPENTSQIPDSIVVKAGGTECLRFWLPSDVPQLLSRLIANAGLHQRILNRSLYMAGFPVPHPYQAIKKQNGVNDSKNRKTSLRLPVLVQAEELTRWDELLALVAIACQLDPQWRKWKYCRPKRSTATVPWRDNQFKFLSNGTDFQAYLDFVENHVYPNVDQFKDSLEEDPTALPQEYQEAKRKINRSISKGKNKRATPRSSYHSARLPVWGNVLSCPVVVGEMAPSRADVPFLKSRTAQKNRKTSERGRLTVPKYDFEQVDRSSSQWTSGDSTDHDLNLLIQFLAYSANGDPDMVHVYMRRMVNQHKL